MIFHENRLLADDSHEISYLILSKIRKDCGKFVDCCSRDWRLKGLMIITPLTNSYAYTYQSRILYGKYMATNKRYAQNFILPFDRYSKATILNPLSKQF